MTIVRVGLGETKKYAAGYDAIFAKKKASPGKKSASGKGKKSKKSKKS